MPALGTFLLYLALFASVYAVIAGTIAGRTRRLDLILSSERAITAQFVLVAICFVLLDYFFLTDRFHLEVIVESMFNGGANCYLSSRVKLLNCLSHNMGTVMSNNF